MSYNTRSPAVKRLMKEAQELSFATELFHAKPLEDNLFEWHFTIRGPSETDYDGGIYHGRILLPAEYPMKPPNILLMTPSGRFEINRKICLSISGYHPETWRPSWSIRTALLAIIGFMPTHGVGAIGSLEYPPEERRKLAKSSVDYICPQCGGIKDMLKSLTEASVDDVKEAKTLAAQISFTGAKDGDDKLAKVQGDEAVKVDDAVVPDSVPSVIQCYSQWGMPPSMVAPMQPLSFEDWCRQMSPQPTEVNKGDEPRLSELSSTPATAGSSVTQTDTPHNDPSPVVTNNAVNQSDSRIQSTNDTRATITRDTIESLQQRQTFLVQCMAVVATILGIFLAVRLNSLGSMNN